MLCGFTPFWDSGSPVKIYENILRGKVKYPPYLHNDAVDLLSQLITSDLTKRLGNLHGGPDDVKNHAWFAEVTWDRVMPANTTSTPKRQSIMAKKAKTRTYILSTAARTTY
jgi:serine/threonine protein kinase